jgi:hypothetical protein
MLYIRGGNSDTHNPVFVFQIPKIYTLHAKILKQYVYRGAKCN